MAKTLKGAALVHFVEDRKRAMQEGRIKPVTLARAIKTLDQVVTHNPIWDLDHNEYPSLPARPSFASRADGGTYSTIPIPKEHRQRWGARERQKR